MRTVVVGERPPELQAWLDRRRALGLDRFDEVWQGEDHVNPAPHGRHADIDEQLAIILGPLARSAGLWSVGPINLGEPQDYRIPDRACLASRSDALYFATAAIVVEILSPGDESRRKVGFYYDHGVDELVLADADHRAIEWYGRGAGGFERAGRSRLLGISEVELADRLDWPPGV